MKQTLQQLRKDVFEVFAKEIAKGDIYINHDPKKEKGLQYDLFLHLKKKGYDVVYELELSNLGQYLHQGINEDKTFSHEEGSLVPDIVVNLGEEGFACFELKYNETNKTLYDHDGDKCRVYVEHCSDVHYAGFIDFLKGDIDGYEANACKDPDYKFYYYYKCDENVKKDKALSKAEDAYSIRKRWEDKLEKIKQKKAEFSKFDGTNYVCNIK